MNEFDEIAERMADNVRRTGRSCMGVFPDETSTDPANDAFVYTIGNALKGFPELLIVGLFDDRGILNRMSEVMIERGRAFDDGEFVEFGGSFSLPAIEAADVVKERYTVQATRFLRRHDYRVMQIVLCDKAGLFPWQPGCAKPYADVVVHRAKPVN